MEQDHKQNTANLDKLTKIFMHPEMEPDHIKLPLEALDSPNWEKYESSGNPISGLAIFWSCSR